MLINVPLIDTKLYVHNEICWRESVCFTAVEVAETSKYRNEKLTPSLVVHMFQLWRAYKI